MKKVFLSDTNKRIGGVLGGIGETYDIGITLLRVFTILLAILTGFFPVVIAYFFSWLVIPEKPRAIIARPPVSLRT